jgi:hypothetical protein
LGQIGLNRDGEKNNDEEKKGKESLLKLMRRVPTQNSKSKIPGIFSVQGLFGRH